MPDPAVVPTDPDPEPVPLNTLADEITELAAHIAAATYRFLVLIREFDAREGGAGAELLRPLAELAMRHRPRRGPREGPGGPRARGPAFDQ